MEAGKPGDDPCPEHGLRMKSVWLRASSMHTSIFVFVFSVCLCTQESFAVDSLASQFSRRSYLSYLRYLVCFPRWVRDVPCLFCFIRFFCCVSGEQCCWRELRVLLPVTLPVIIFQGSGSGVVRVGFPVVGTGTHTLGGVRES